MNAFTTKPNIADFIKQQKKSAEFSAKSTALVQNPSEQQRIFLEINKDMPTTKTRGNWPAPVVQEQAAPAPAKKKPAPKSNPDFVAVDVPFEGRQYMAGVSMYQEQIEFLLSNTDGKALDCRDVMKARRLITALQRTINNRKLRDKVRVAQRQVDGVTRVWVLSREKA